VRSLSAPSVEPESGGASLPGLTAIARIVEHVVPPHPERLKVCSIAGLNINLEIALWVRVDALHTNLSPIRSDGLIRTNDSVDGMTLKQLRTGILERCRSGRLTTPYVALIDRTMQRPFRHFFSRSPRTIHGSIPIHGDWHSDRWHPKKENPATVRYAGRGSGPFFFVRECRGPWR
jgi:hypothetical protein